MKISIDDADKLVSTALVKGGFTADEARIITDQIIGCEVRGVSYGGLSRAISLIDRRGNGPEPSPIQVVRETDNSALIDGGDSCGYLVAHRAVELGMAKAEATGIGIVGAFRTYYTGMYVHYLEQATKRNLIAMATGSSSPRVAPFGSNQGRFGTNPIAFAFPSETDPIIFDTATSGIPIAEAVLAQRSGNQLKPSLAFDAEGSPTTDPVAALQGALSVWGGHRGAGLGIVVQLLGILVGGGAMPADYRDCGFFFLTFRPDLFADPATFRRNVSAYADMVRQARPIDPAAPVRMPFDRSAETRRKILAAGTFEVPEQIIQSLEAIAGR